MIVQPNDYDGSAKPTELRLPLGPTITAHDQDTAPLKLEERRDWDRKARIFS